jgi:DNA polymerase I
MGLFGIDQTQSQELHEDIELNLIDNIEQLTNELKANGKKYYFFSQINADSFEIILVNNKKKYKVTNGIIKNHFKELSKILSNLYLYNYDWKSELKQLHLYNIYLDDKYNIFDLSLAQYLLSYGAWKDDKYNMIYQYMGEMITPGQKTKIQEAYILYKIGITLKEKIDQQNEVDTNNLLAIKNLYYEIEMPLSEILILMEKNGIGLDSDKLNQFADEITEQLNMLKNTIFEIAGVEFNIASPKQLGAILFDKLGLNYKGKKSKDGNYLTNEKILRSIINEHEIIQHILQYRELSKVLSTYTQTLIQKVEASSKRIHTTFKQNIAATGRLTSVNPNLQNIPQIGQYAQKIRSCFVPAEKSKFMFFDYSQQELRLLAHFSNEIKLIKAFQNGIDIHTLTAMSIFQKRFDEISKEERRVGKTVNFGVVYGISSFGLSEQLNISRNDAQIFIDSFYSTYPSVKLYFDKIINDAKSNNYVSSIFGRRRNTKDLNSHNYMVRSAVEREAINFPLQASAADMIKYAMVKIYNYLVKNDLIEKIKPILQIHDELIFEVNEQFINSHDFVLHIKAIRNIMVSILSLTVPIIVDIKIGTSLTNQDNFILE